MRKCTGWHWLWNIWEDTELKVFINNSFQVTRQNRIPAGFQAINWLLGSIKSWRMWKHVQSWKRHRFLKAMLLFAQLLWLLWQWEKKAEVKGGWKIEIWHYISVGFVAKNLKTGWPIVLKPLPFLPCRDTSQFSKNIINSLRISCSSNTMIP